MEWRGLGDKKIIEGYWLVWDKKVKIENGEKLYWVSLGMIKKEWV